MDRNTLVQFVNNFYNTYLYEFRHFAFNENYVNNDRQFRGFFILRGLIDDLNIINNSALIAAKILERSDQLDVEINRFNFIMQYEINNRWLNLYDLIEAFIGGVRGAVGLYLINESQINIQYENYNAILNQLNIGFLINDNHMNEENYEELN